jgi:CheY-like chemotaxis protein
MLEGKTILVLEDEPIIGFGLEDLLLDAGCASVAIATRLDEAQSLIAAHSFDAAILDVNIHGERSYAIADTLAGLGTPYIFASGYGDSEHPRQHALTPTITKPYNKRAVGEALGLAFQNLSGPGGDARPESLPDA